MTLQSLASPDHFSSVFALQLAFRPSEYNSCLTKMPDSLRLKDGLGWQQFDVNEHFTLVLNNTFVPQRPGERPTLLRLATYLEFIHQPTTPVFFDILGHELFYVEAAYADIIRHHNLVWIEGPGCPPVQAYCEIDVEAEDF